MKKKTKDKILLIIIILAIILVIAAMYVLTERKKDKIGKKDIIKTQESGLEIITRNNIIDNDQNKMITPGDEIILDTEHFYVIKTNEETNTIVMISKYNLNIGNNPIGEANGLQNSECTGFISKKNSKCTIAFSSTNYWESFDSSYPIEAYGESSNLYPLIATYLNHLKNIGHNPISGSLLTKEQHNSITNLCLEKDENNECLPPSWLYNSSFWTGYAETNTNIAIISKTITNKSIKYSKNNQVGLRPIIVISAAEI